MTPKEELPLQRKVISTLLVVCLVLSSIPVLFFTSPANEDFQTKMNPTRLDFKELSELYGEQIPVVVRFNNGFSAEVRNVISHLGLKFSLGTASKSHVGQHYLLEGSPDRLQALMDHGLVASIAPQTHARQLESARDLSMPEINADDVWAMLDDFSRNLTGHDILIADLDSGVDWSHPDLLFADGGSYPYVNSTPWGFTNGTDAVDMNRDFALTANESIYALDINNNSIFDVKTDWLWVDNVTQNGIPDFGEAFFVVNDTSGNGLLDGGEELILLETHKTKYIFEKDGMPSPSIQMWERGRNLTISGHTDDSPYGGGHGTAVAGVLLGGQLGYRDYVGVAPDAELMMIRVIGDQFTWISIETALALANNTGADVILIEVGSWTYHYLDGSSHVEDMIDDLVADGIPVICPSGNLGGKDKHAMVTTSASIPHFIDFLVPTTTDPYIEEEITNVSITVLTVDPTDFSACNFSLVLSGTPVVLNPGIGRWNWFVQMNVLPNLHVKSFISISSRGTRMLAICLWGVIPQMIHQLGIQTPDDTTIHAFISDDQSGWTGGCIWMTDMVNSHHITWPSTADSAISVASYRTRNLVGGGTIGDLADFSSRGPRIDGVIKQSVAAPGGYDIISDYAAGSAWDDWFNAYGNLPFIKRIGGYRLFSGTSASGPHVAGAAALLLQVNNSIGDQVKGIIETSAAGDGFAGTIPNNDWGYGKLDVEAAIITFMPSLDVEGPDIGSHTRSPTAPNSTDSVTVRVTVTDPSGVHTVIMSYYNGTTWLNVTMTWTGSVYEATIPALPDGTSVTYRFYANDTIGNWSVSGDHNYSVSDAPPTTGPTPTSPPPTEPDYLRLAIILSAVFALIILGVVCSKRKKR